MWAYRLDWAITVAQYFEASLLDAYRAIPYLIDMIRYLISLFVFYMVAKYYGSYFLAAALGERGISAAAHMQPIVKRFIYDKYIKREVTL